MPTRNNIYNHEQERTKSLNTTAEDGNPSQTPLKMSSEHPSEVVKQTALRGNILSRPAESNVKIMRIMRKVYLYALPFLHKNTEKVIVALGAVSHIIGNSYFKERNLNNMIY